MDIAEIGTSDKQAGILLITSDIVQAYLSKNPLPVAEVSGLIASVYAAVSTAVHGAIAAVVPAEEKKATPSEIARSITPAGLVSFIDGKTYQTLKRHLSTHGTDMAAYRQRFGLPADYPSTAPAYSVKRSALAKATGLGQSRAAPSAPAPMQAAA